MKIAFTGVGIPLDNNAPVDGFTMAGPLYLSEYPVIEMQAANKGYIDVADNALSVRVSDIESTMSALVTDPVAKTYVDAQDALKLNLVGGILTGALTLFGAPTASLHAATKTYVDTADLALSARMTTAEGEIDVLAVDKADKSYVDTQDATKVALAGSTMTGSLTLSGAPVVALHAATKAYVDSGDATKLALAGGTMTGAIVLSGAPTIAMHPVTKAYADGIETAVDARLDVVEGNLVTLNTDPTTKAYVDAQDATKVAKAGSTMTGPLVLSADPVSNLQAATKQYADGKVPTAGGTMTGLLTLSSNPTVSMHAATKAYVDSGDAALDTRLDAAEATIATLNTNPVTKAYVDTADALKVAKSGDTMTGALTLSGAPTVGLHAATMSYVDSTVAASAATKLPLAGGTLTGALTLSGSPTVALHAATKAYADTMVPLAGGTMTGLLILSGAPSIANHATTKTYVDTATSGLNTRLTTVEGTVSALNTDPTTKTYVDTSISTHASNATLHITAGQNTFLDAVTVSATEVNRLAGVTSAVQGQLDSKLPLSGGTLTGNLVMTAGTRVTVNSSPTNSTDAVNKSYVDGLIQGLKWKAPILDSNIVAIGLNTPPGSPTQGYSYVVGTAPTGAWSTFANKLVTYKNSAWTDVAGRVLQVGDRLGVGFEVSSGALDASVLANDNRIMVVSGVSPLTYTVETNAENDTTLVTDSDSFYYGSNYTYTAASGWVKVSSNINFSTGTGLILAGSVLGANLSSGIEEYTGSGPSKLRAKLYPSSGLILTTDGTNASTSDSASIAVSVDGTTVSVTAGKVAISAAMQTTISGKLDKTGGTMTGMLTLPSAPTVALHAATKAYADTMVPLAGGTMTGLLTLSGAPTLGGHATTKTYVDSADSALNTRLTTAEGTLATLNANPVTKAYVDTADATKLALAGGTMTGALTLSGAPTVALHAATKTYVDAADTAAAALKLSLTGGTLTGALTLSGAPTVALHAATKAYADTMVPLAGGTMTGLLVLSGAPTLGTHATTKTYVDSADSALNTRLTTAEGTIATLNANPVTKAYVDTADALKLALTGGTLTGALTLSGAPTVALHAATKAYADTMVPLAGGTMTGLLTLSGAPTLGGHATTKTYVDSADSALNTRLTTAEGTLATLNANPVTKAYVDTADATKLALAGGTMTGLLTLSGAPSAANHAATKSYVDTADATKLPLAGGTLTGALTLSGAPTVALHAATKAYADTMLPLAGGTMTGNITLSGAPTVGLHPATKTYVDTADATKLALAGGTMTGAITLSGAPTLGNHATTKTYTDTADALKLNKAGDTMTGSLTLSGAPTVALHAATKAYVDSVMDTMSIYQQIMYMNMKY